MTESLETRRLRLAALREQQAEPSMPLDQTQVEKNRADKLMDLLDRLKRGEHVQNRTLKTWLTSAEYEELEGAWTEQLDVRAELREKPEEVKHYEELLRAADFEHNKGNYYKAEARYEAALEYLQEAVGADRTLVLWFDRATDWTADGDLALSPTSVPRCKISRSQYAYGGVVTRDKISKREVKIGVLERALSNLGF